MRVRVQKIYKLKKKAKNRSKTSKKRIELIQRNRDLLRKEME